MLKTLLRPFAPRPALQRGRGLYAAAAAQARHPAFYTDFGVADSPTGRFELYALHLILVLHRLKGRGAEASEISQAAFDAFISELDGAMRDLGVGDLSMAKKMRKLGEAFYGRVKSYDAALEALPDHAPLQALLTRTVYEEREETGAAALGVYTEATVAALAAAPFEDIREARLPWPTLPAACA